MVTARRVFETVLYADDLAQSERFYRDVLGLEVIQSSELFVTLRCGDAVLLIFDPENSTAVGRSVPSHGTRGPGHIAFPARDDELEAWRRQLRDHDVAIESEVEWPSGGRSIYFRDPAGNSLELAPPTLWGGAREF